MNRSPCVAVLSALALTAGCEGTLPSTEALAVTSPSSCEAVPAVVNGTFDPSLLRLSWASFTPTGNAVRRAAAAIFTRPPQLTVKAGEAVGTSWWSNWDEPDEVEGNVTGEGEGGRRAPRTIANKDEAVWMWHSGLSGVNGAVYYDQGVKVVNGLVTDDPPPALEPGRWYSFLVWSWNDDRDLAYSSKPVSFCVVEAGTAQTCPTASTDAHLFGCEG